MKTSVRAFQQTSWQVPQSYLVTALALLVLLGFTGSLLIGPSGLGIKSALSALFGVGDAAEASRIIMRDIRLPRAILGLLIGGIIGLSGAALQGYLRNPLAEPGLIGVSAGGALGAVIALHTGLAAISVLALPIAALVVAFLAVALVLGLAGRNSGPLTLILAGVAVTSFAGALTSLTLNLSKNAFAATEIIFWLLGSLSDRSMTHVWLAGPLIIVAAILLFSLPRALDALTLGDDVAANLGIDLRKTRIKLVFGTALGIGAATSVAGAIGFVGLVVPHLLRPLTGFHPGKLLVPSALGGAALLLFADIAVRILRPEAELKLGVLTALIGAPFFFYLVIKLRRETIS